MAIHFLFDEELENSTKELQGLIDSLNEDAETRKKVEILNTFTWAVIHSLKKPQVQQPQLTREEIYRRVEVKQKPLSVLSRLFVKDIPPVVKKILPKEIPKPEVKIVEPKLQEPQIIQRDLIKDKITDKVLAYVKITDKYYLIEPILDENDTNVLNKVLYKRPKNMEKGWGLISKYGKKFNVQPDHFTNIKYFVVNFLYGLGRVEALVYDKDVREIYCDGLNKPVKVKLNDKLVETNILYKSKQEIDNFIYELSYKVKQKIKKNNPAIKFSYRDMDFECIIGFAENTESKFTIIKKI